MSRNSGFYFLFLSYLIFSAPAQAESIRSIHRDGNLELEDGQQVSLAGLYLSPEAYRILPALLSDRRVEIEYLRPAMPNAKLKSKAAYVFVKTRELQMPFRAGAEPQEVRMMINETLLKMGAATVDTSQTFERKEQFIQVESQAKLEGQGIWSYQNE